MKKEKVFVEETAEQKAERWTKQSKAARSFAKQCGISFKKVSRERKMTESLKELSRRETGRYY